MRIIHLLLISIVSIASAGEARAACAHPLAAVQTLLDNLQASGEWNPSAAAECFPPSEDVETTALHLKQVLEEVQLHR